VSPQRLFGADEGDEGMEDTFRVNWRSMALPLMLTTLVIGAGLAFALL
jgi:hypothetical protein